MSEPWLSVIIPALDEAAVIRRTLLPLQGWRDQGVELILVDGGSQDDTLALASGLVDRQLSVPRGRAQQMNAGAGQARADLYFFLHADTEVAPLPALAALRRFPGGDHWGWFDVRLSGQHYLFPLIGWLMNWRSALTGIVTGDQGLVIRRSLFRAVGGFPEQPLMEDVAMSRQLKQLERPVRLGRYLCTDSRRWRERGVWRTVWLMWSLRLRYFLGADPAGLARRYR